MWAILTSGMISPVVHMKAGVPRPDRPGGFDDDVTYPEALVSLFVEEFTRPGDLVFDPFAGFGTTLVVAEQMGRNVLGLEILPERVDFIRRRLHNPAAILEGDALRLADLDLPVIDFVMTSPPYMNRVNHPQNPLTGYSTLDGNYERYLTQVGDVFRALRQRLRPEGKIVVSVANIASSPVTTLAWDLGAELARTFRFVREIVIDWDKMPPQLTEDYCLVFERSE
jgi:DNA modification methylase